MDSILNSIKKLLGIQPEYTYFDQDLIIHINSTFMILNQLGVGPYDCFSIQDDKTTWDDFIPNNKKLESLKSYMYMKVKLMFDPPLSSVVMEATNRMISELEFRLLAEASAEKKSEESE